MDAMYPRVLTETGLLGVCAFLALVMAIGRVSYRAATKAVDPYLKGLALGFLFGFIGLLAHAIGANTFIIVRIMEPFWLVAALTVCMYQREQTVPDFNERPVVSRRTRPVTANAS